MDFFGSIMIGVIFWSLVMLTYTLCQIGKSKGKR